MVNKDPLLESNQEGVESTQSDFPSYLGQLCTGQTPGTKHLFLKKKKTTKLTDPFSTLFLQYCSSVAKSCLTLCDPMNCSTSLSFIISWSLLKLMWIKSVMPSNQLTLCCPLLLLLSIFPSIPLFQWIGSAHQVPKELQLHQSFQWIFSVDFPYHWQVWSCCPRDSQES